MNMTYKRTSGFTLIELVIVITLLGILVAVALPRFANLTTDAQTAAAQGTTAAVRSAYAIATADAQGNPTGTQIIGQLTGGNPTFNTDSIDITMDNGGTVSVPLFTDSGCTTAATAASDVILCVGTGTYTP